MYLNVFGEIYRVVKRDDEGAWIISCENPSCIEYACASALCQYDHAELPEDSFLTSENPVLSKAEKVRYDIITPLISDERCITDPTYLRKRASELAEHYSTTQKRILRNYYRYMSGNPIIKKKEDKKRRESNLSRYEQTYIKAINKYYFSAKKYSLRDTYDLMIIEFFSDDSGAEYDAAPSWSSFKYFFYEKMYHKKSQRHIARDGLTNYQRNARPLHGSAMNWRENIGAYQMDETTADIYILTEQNKPARPYIYLAVDTVTQLIAGVHVGFKSGEHAVMSCIANCASDKIKFCKKYGIEISEYDWPSIGMPYEIIIDNGRDFTSKSVKKMCKQYNITHHILPPFRPDEKGLVEKALDIIQQRYKSILRGKGVVDDKAAERWSASYCEQALLNLREFTQIILNCIVYLNSSRTLTSLQIPQEMMNMGLPPTSAGLWRYYQSIGKSGLLPVNEADLRYVNLSKEVAELTRKGISFHHFTYSNREFMQSEKGVSLLGKELIVAYDEDNVDSVFVITGKWYIPFHLSSRYSIFKGLSFKESEERWKSSNAYRNSHKHHDDEGRRNLINKIIETKNSAEEG